MLEVDGVATGSRWRVVLIQEGRVVARTTARAGGPSGVTCRAVGTLRGG